MIKKISVVQLRVGMYVHDLKCRWFEPPFLRNRFLVKSNAEILRITKVSTGYLFIDTEQGLDVDEPTSTWPAPQCAEHALASLAVRNAARKTAVSISDELNRAIGIKNKAYELLKKAMVDVRLGRAVNMDEIDSVVDDIAASISRNPAALIGLVQLKDKDTYTFLHSVSVCALMIAFCRSLNMDAETVRQAGIGGLLHDVGKAIVPDEILNKPERLTDPEFEVVKGHPADGHAMLTQISPVGAVPLDIVLNHHERIDGSG